MLLYVALLAAFCGCVALGVAVKHADVHCAMTAMTVPFPASVARHEVAAEQTVPCDADEPVADAS